MCRRIDRPSSRHLHYADSPTASQETSRPDADIAGLRQMGTNVDLDLAPSLHETTKAVKQLFSGKAPESGAMPAEIYKHGGPQLMDYLTALLQEMWRQGLVPLDLKDATIVLLYRRKGNRQLCDNHQDSTSP
nr:unnamed protein product [Spirometra erinaceieuropaei]